MLTKVTNISDSYDKVYTNSEFKKLNAKVFGQFIIVDSGCPRSLLGRKELDELKQYKKQIYNIQTENFTFGPSKLYSSNSKVKIAIKIAEKNINFDFFYNRRGKSTHSIRK